MNPEEILSEFLTATVISEDHYSNLIGMEFNESSYVELFSEITLAMLSSMNYIPKESSLIRTTVRDLFNQNPVEFGKLKSGDSKLQGFFIGRCIKVIGPKYNPKDIGARIAEMIKEENTKEIWEV